MEPLEDTAGPLEGVLSYDLSSYYDNRKTSIDNIMSYYYSSSLDLKANPYT